MKDIKIGSFLRIAWWMWLCLMALTIIGAIMWLQGANTEPALVIIGAFIAFLAEGIGFFRAWQDRQEQLQDKEEIIEAARDEGAATRKALAAEHELTRQAVLENSQNNKIPLSLSSASQAVKEAYLALDKPDKLLRQNAIETLKESNDEKAVDVLELAVKHSTPSVRIEAALALADKTEGKNEYALSGLLEALDVEDVDTKDRALKCIWQIFFEIPSSVSPKSIEKLVRVLSDMDVDTRWAAEHVLISQCDKTLPYLINAINHDFSSVQIAALEAIWIITTNNTLPRSQLLTAVPALIEALGKHDQSVMPRDKKFTSVSGVAQKILVELAPIDELEEYLQNDRTWMHQHVQKVIAMMQGGNETNNTKIVSEIPEANESKPILEDLFSHIKQSQYTYSIGGIDESIARDDLVTMIEQTRSMMMDFATEKGYSGAVSWKAKQETDYERNREIILGLEEAQIKKLIPQTLKTHTTLSSFRKTMQSEYEHYKERLEFIRTSFSQLIELLNSDKPE